MSDELDPTLEPGDESPGQVESAGSGAPKDLPIGIVIAGLAIAILVFGAIGVKRYRALRTETMLELAAEGRRSFEAGQAEAHRMAAERAAATKSEEAADAAATDSGEEAAPAVPPVTQTTPSGP